VFLMQAGFAMLCAGSIRAKNVKNILLKNLLDACGGAIGFWTVGYAFAYDSNTSGNTSFIGSSNFFLLDFSSGSDYIGFFFQYAFAATCATIVAGTVAERCKMQAYLFYSVFLTGFVYPVVVRSIWSGNGMLTAFSDDPFRGVGVVDFAGSGVVHMTGGATALVAAVILGPRKGRFYDEAGEVLETPHDFPPHSVALQVLGTFILWFGWFGFNPGSALVIDNPDSAATAALCAVTTTISAATGCATAMFFDSVIEAKKSGQASYDLTMAMNGALSGLVAITAGCAVVTPGMALIIGCVAGLVYYGFSKFLVRLKIDDAVDAIPVHYANGLWGVLAVGLFAEPDLMATAGYNAEHSGWFYSWGNGSGDANLLFAQLVAIVWINGWVMTVMTPFFYGLNAFGMFRVDPDEEDIGLDISHHRGAAYNMTSKEADAFGKETTEELASYDAKETDEAIHDA
jgi:Amt family ammonium transporter